MLIYSASLYSCPLIVQFVQIVFDCLVQNLGMSWTQGGLQFRLPMFALNVGFCAMESIGKAGTGCLATQASMCRGT